MAANGPEAGGLSNVAQYEHKPGVLSQADGFNPSDFAALQAPTDNQRFLEHRLYARLENIVTGIEPSYQPGHGWVIARTLSALTDVERKYEPSDDYPDVEVMKFVVDYKSGEQGFVVHQKGVFAGLQLSLTKDGQVRIAGGSLDIESAADLVSKLEQRLALRAYLSQESVV